MQKYDDQNNQRGKMCIIISNAISLSRANRKHIQKIVVSL